MTDNEQRKAAKEFASYWRDKGHEKGESQSFWLSLSSMSMTWSGRATEPTALTSIMAARKGGRRLETKIPFHR